MAGIGFGEEILVGADRGLEVADFDRIGREPAVRLRFQPDQPGILAPIVDDGDPLGSGERVPQAGEEQQPGSGET